MFRRPRHLNAVRLSSPVARSNTVAGSGAGVVDPPSPIEPLNPSLPKSVRPLPRLFSEQSFEIVLLFIVMAPFSAMALPHRIVAALFSVIDWAARMFPANVVPVHRGPRPIWSIVITAGEERGEEGREGTEDFAGAGNGIRTRDPDLGKVVLYH